MYSNKLAVAIKHNDKVLREDQDKVYVPFGSEYTISLKNLNSLKCQFKFFIDGVDATDGSPLVIMPNTTTEIRRFIKNGNKEQGNCFKFIEKTKEISEYRGDNIDDGLIRIEYQFEKIHHLQDGFKFNDPWVYPIGNKPWLEDNMYGNGSLNIHGSSNIHRSVTPITAQGMQSVVISNQVGEKGITVPGSVSNRQFVYTSSFPLDPTRHVMVIKLVGEVSGQVITKPITVNTKPKCVTCGLQNRASHKFCSQCGTGLMVF